MGSFRRREVQGDAAGRAAIECVVGETIRRVEVWSPGRWEVTPPGRRPSPAEGHLGPVAAGIAQFLISVYGGYFGGGIGFLMLAALTMAGLPVRAAGATKNVLAMLVNGVAAVLFIAVAHVAWGAAGILAAGSIIGGQLGAMVGRRLSASLLRAVIVVVGVAASIVLLVE